MTNVPSLDSFPLGEFDPAPEAVIEPSRVPSREDVPEACVLCFFKDAIGLAVERGEAAWIRDHGSEMGRHPLHRLDVDGQSVGLFHPGVGAPLAAGFLEELIAIGFRKFVVCGGAGVLDPTIPVGHVVVPTSAVRDEGTSHHYLPPSREVAPHPAALEAVRRTLTARGVPFLTGKTWTTDAIYRETRAKVERRRAEGCLTVEMEAASLFAVARFRGVPIAAMLYGGDSVGGETWDARKWRDRPSLRESLMRVAAECALAIPSPAAPTEKEKNTP